VNAQEQWAGLARACSLLPTQHRMYTAAAPAARVSIFRLVALKELEMLLLNSDIGVMSACFD
jgi:hypothetical protein